MPQAFIRLRRYCIYCNCPSSSNRPYCDHLGHCNDYISVHNKSYLIIHIDNSYDSDDGGGEEPLIQEQDLDSLVRQVPPELQPH